MNKITFKGESKGWIAKFEIILGILSLFSLIYLIKEFVFDWIIIQTEKNNNYFAPKVKK